MNEPLPGPHLPDWRKEPVFVLTSDIDWASEYAIGELLGFAKDRGIRPTLFVTHPSEVIDRAAARGEIDRGIHPNFLPGSSHGAEPQDVIAHCLKLAPGTRMSRSHTFVDGTTVALKLFEAGIRIDSNLCLYMQPALGPLEHWVGIRRFPVFWEDDVHWHRGGAWHFDHHADAFFTPGLKIVNFHPFIFALNIGDGAMYQAVKSNITSLNGQSAAALRSTAPGPADFLAGLAEAVKSRGLRWHSLTDVAAAAMA